MISKEQLEARRRHVGSSDSAALMGLDPHRSPADVFYDKTGLDPGFAGNAATDRGNRLEPVLLDWAEEQLGYELRRGVMQVHEGGILAANFDGIGHGAIVEAKTSNGMKPDEWGDPDAPDAAGVPTRVIVQTHHAMHVAGPLYRVAFVPVLLPVYGVGFDFRMYRVDRDDDVARGIAEAGEKFWRDHVLAGIQPDDFRPSLEVLKRLRREPAKVIPIDGALADRLVSARAACKVANEQKEEAERAVLTALSDAEGGDCGDGRIVTYMESMRKGYTVESTKFRTLRVKPAKEK